MALQDFPLERPNEIPVVHFVCPPGDTGHQVTSCWIPFDVSGHVVFPRVHRRHVRRVDEFENSVHAGKEIEVLEQIHIIDKLQNEGYAIFGNNLVKNNLNI